MATIKNLNVDNPNKDYQGLFGCVNGIIKNLTVTGSVTGKNYVGGIAGNADGMNCGFENCHNECDVTGKESYVKAYVGGIVGATDGNMIGCTNSGTIVGNNNTGNGGGTGGIVGSIEFSCKKVEGCSNTGTVSGSKIIGGIVGNTGTTSTFAITDCHNKKDVSGNQYVGGIVGYQQSSTVQNCDNTGKVYGTSNDNEFIGGIIGGAKSGSYGQISYCYNTKEVSGNKSVGGIIGYNLMTVTGCYNTAPISGNENVGGIVGKNMANVIGCYNTAHISGTDTDTDPSKGVGGIAGAFIATSGDKTITDCYNIGKVSGTDYVGGIIGMFYDDNNTLKYSFNAGTVTGSGAHVGAVAGSARQYDVFSAAIFQNTYYLTSTYSGTGCGGQSDKTGIADSEGVIEAVEAITDLKDKLGDGWHYESDGYPQITGNERELPPCVIISSLIGGKIAANPTRAEEGETVTLTVEPDEGYSLISGPTAVYGAGKTVTVEGAENTYTFTMPESDVTVSAIFMKDGMHTIVDKPIVAEPKIEAEGVPADAFNSWSAAVSDESMGDLNALGEVIDENDDLYDEAKDKLGNPDENVYIHVVTDLELTVEKYDSATNTLTVDVSAIRHILASTKKTLTDDQLEHPGQESNVVEIRPEHVVPINTPVTIVLPLPETLYKSAQNVDVRHIHNGKTKKQTVANANNSATVTVDGLSEFMISPASETPASWEVIAGDQTVTAESSGDSTIKVPNNITTATITGTSISATVNGEEVSFTDGNADVDLKPGENVIVIQNGGETHTITITRAELTDISVYFKPVSGNKRQYEIILKAGNGKLCTNTDAKQLDGIINRLNSADLTFALDAADGVAYRIAPAEYIDLIDAGEGRYEFNFKKGDDNENNTDNEIVIGTVEFLGYGNVESFKVKSEGVGTNAVHPTTGFDNIVKDYTPTGTEGNGTLHITDVEKFEDVSANVYYGTITGDFGVETQEVTINVMFPNKLADTINNDYIKDMTVTVEGGPAFKSGKIPLGNYNEVPEALKGVVTSITKKDFDYTTQKAPAEGTEPNANGYQIKMNVPVPADTGARYTFTFSGEGYRTFSHDVVVDGKKTITVWNNAMDDKTLIVEDGDEKKDNFDVTFLAGDIVEDNKINLYDLSAVAAYFGRDKLKNEDGTPAADMDKYIQYDLNRDGQIDSKDIAMVLVSWDR